MVMDRLHIICGNCGCNSQWEWEHVPNGIDIDGELFPTVYIWCGNCSTLHSLDKYAKERTR